MPKYSIKIQIGDKIWISDAEKLSKKQLKQKLEVITDSLIGEYATIKIKMNHLPVVFPYEVFKYGIISIIEVGK